MEKNPDAQPVHTTKDTQFSWKWGIISICLIIISVFSIINYSKKIPETIHNDSTTVSTVDSSLNYLSEKLFSNWVYVLGGTFQMGDTYNEGEDREQPVHKVRVNGFILGMYEVTQAEWRAVMGYNPSYFNNCDDCPVERVSWEDVSLFIKKLNALTGKKYRLPTEAEWEYAAGGGGSFGRFRSGNGQDILRPREANFNGSFDYKETYSESGEYRAKTTSGGNFYPNTLALRDMTGNVWEWCSDWYGEYSSASQNNPKGAKSGTHRVMRGGSWTSPPRFARVSTRNLYPPEGGRYDLGFRLAEDVDLN